MGKCHIVTDSPPDAARLHPKLAPLTLKITSGGVSDEALAEFKGGIPAADRHWGGHNKELEPPCATEWAWFVAPASLEFVKAWAVKHYSAAFLTEGKRETDLHTGRATEQQGLFG